MSENLNTNTKTGEESELLESPCSKRSIDFEKLMDRATGWRARKELGTLIEKARCSLSAAQVYEEDRNWNDMLEELDDFVSEGTELIAAIKRYS